MTRCFVIGPIGDRMAPVGSPGREKYEQALEVFEGVIMAACSQVGLTPVRADRIAAAGEITEQVFRHLYEDDVVIADVSDGNPNVMYELGLRHTRNLLTIQIGEYGQLPFDVAAIRTIQFSRSERGLIDARNQLVAALQVGLTEGPDPLTATKIWQRDSSVGSQLNPEETGLDIDLEPIDESEGFVDAMATVETTFPLLTEHIAAIGDLMVEMATLTEESFRDVNGAQNLGATQRLTVIKNYSDGLSDLASRIQSEVEEYADAMDRIDGSVNGVLTYLGKNYTEYDAEVDEFLRSLAELGVSAREGTEGFGEVTNGLQVMQDVSRLLRPPARTIGSAVSKLITHTRLMDEWESIAVGLRRRVLPSDPVSELDGGGMSD